MHIRNFSEIYSVPDQWGKERSMQNDYASSLSRCQLSLLFNGGGGVDFSSALFVINYLKHMLFLKKFKSQVCNLVTDRQKILLRDETSSSSSGVFVAKLLNAGQVPSDGAQHFHLQDNVLFHVAPSSKLWPWTEGLYQVSPDGSCPQFILPWPYQLYSAVASAGRRSTTTAGQEARI